LNHREKMIAEPSRLISRKPTENVELIFGFGYNFIFFRKMMPSSRLQIAVLTVTPRWHYPEEETNRTLCEKRLRRSYE